MSRINQILGELHLISIKFNLKFNKNWFKYVWITKEQGILSEYFSDCQDPIYKKYGIKIYTRIKNLDKFYNSYDYKKCSKRCGGQILTQKSFYGFRDFVKKIKNKKVVNILLDFCDIIERGLKYSNTICALTETNIEKERKRIIFHTLRHEWIHILLEENGIRSKNWKYNEGLVTYIEFFIDNKLVNLEKSYLIEKYDFNREYFSYAIIYRNQLKRVNDINKIDKIKTILRTVNL